MSRFSEVLEKQIAKKAENLESQFWKEFEQLFTKYGITVNARFASLKEAFGKHEDKGEEWRKRLKEHLVAIETDKFIRELSRLEHYFQNKDIY